MAAGYALDLLGLPIAPWALLVTFVVALMRAAVVLKPRFDPVFLLVVAGMFAYAMWQAAPAFLPVTNGPDVVHHLQLIHVIAASGRLPHDAAQAPYLLEMMSYTPGSHVLAAAVAAWLRVDALRVVYPIAAFFVAIKAGSLYVLARRLIGAVPGGAIAALAAPVLALAPVTYFLGSFVQFFFYAQVVSEAFAIGLIVALLRWTGTCERRDAAAVAMCAIGVVLSWPIWIVPCAMTIACALMAAPMSWRSRAIAGASMLAPALTIAAVHQLTHRDAASILTASGAVTAPSLAVLGVAFLHFAVGGMLDALRQRATRLVSVFLVSTLLTALALAGLGGFRSLYMPFKMVYLAVLPGAVLAALLLAHAGNAFARRLRRGPVVGAGSALILAVLITHEPAPVPRMRGSLSLPARDVGLWAHGHVPAACVDYFSKYWLTGYWLHLDVLGNPRLSDRMRQETFDFPDVAAKWIEGRGLPYAIVEDMQAIPREIRSEMTPMYQSGPFVLVRNARPAACAEAAR